MKPDTTKPVEWHEETQGQAVDQSIEKHEEKSESGSVAGFINALRCDSSSAKS